MKFSQLRISRLPALARENVAFPEYKEDGVVSNMNVCQLALQVYTKKYYGFNLKTRPIKGPTIAKVWYQKGNGDFLVPINFSLSIFLVILLSLKLYAFTAIITPTLPFTVQLKNSREKQQYHSHSLLNDLTTVG